jgi:hypothetical protein
LPTKKGPYVVPALLSDSELNQNWKNINIKRKTRHCFSRTSSNDENKKVK